MHLLTLPTCLLTFDRLQRTFPLFTYL